MRTTVDLPDTLFLALKATAVRRGTSIENLISTAVEVEIRKDQIKLGRRVNFPLLSSAEPGTLNLSNAEIEDFLT